MDKIEICVWDAADGEVYFKIFSTVNDCAMEQLGDLAIRDIWNSVRVIVDTSIDSSICHFLREFLFEKIAKLD